MSQDEHGDSRGLHNLQVAGHSAFLGVLQQYSNKKLNTAPTKNSILCLLALWRTADTVRLALRWNAMGPLLHFPAKQVSGKERVDTKEKLSVAVFWPLTLFLCLSCKHQNLWDWTFCLEADRRPNNCFPSCKMLPKYSNASFLMRINVSLGAYSLLRPQCHKLSMLTIVSCSEVLAQKQNLIHPSNPSLFISNQQKHSYFSLIFVQNHRKQI